MLRHCRIIVTLLVIAAGASVAAAQSGAGRGPEGLTRGLNEFGAWGGVALFDSLNLIGSEEEKSARIGLAALRYARVLAAGHGLAFKYTVDGVPLALLRYDRVRFVPTATPNVFRLAQERTTVYGAGLAPIGLQLNFRRRRRVQPFAGGSVGFLYFREPVPDERSIVEPNRRGAHFNYTAEFGGGVQLLTKARRAYTFGYKYHHLSNWFHAPINPGFDSNLFYAGFSVFK
ncbi:MAG: acyloxyacyl hydrolase [Pyrinomonadaceae bacterium]